MDPTGRLPPGVKHEDADGLPGPPQLLGSDSYLPEHDDPPLGTLGGEDLYLESARRSRRFPMGRSQSAGPRMTPSGSSDGLDRPFSGDALNQKAVAFLAGPRERIHVFGNPVEHCPRCQHEGIGNTNWRPHRHIGELKIRYICERHFNDLESNHHFDIPLCPLCGQVLYLYDFNGMLGISSARRLHKYVLKCANRHVLPMLDLFCQTKKGGERCNANFKLQWSYGTMVKRCEAQKNRDHDLWWVRYKNEWKQRRTIIRYKKDFLSHISDVQRALLLGLGLEGEPPPDPKAALGPTYDALVSSVAGSPTGPKIKKRAAERALLSQLSSGSSPAEDFDLDLAGGTPKRRREVTHPLHPGLPAAASPLYAHGLEAQMPMPGEQPEWLTAGGLVDPGMPVNAHPLYAHMAPRPPHL